MNLAFVFWLAFGLFLWVGLTGRLGWPELLAAAAVVASGYRLWVAQADVATHAPPARAWPIVRALLVYLFGVVAVEVLKGTWAVVRAVLGHPVSPALIEVELPGASPEALLLLAFGKSLSPDTQVLSLDPLQGRLVLHYLDAPDPEAARASLRRAFERHARRATP